MAYGVGNLCGGSDILESFMQKEGSKKTRNILSSRPQSIIDQRPTSRLAIRRFLSAYIDLVFCKLSRFGYTPGFFKLARPDFCREGTLFFCGCL